MGELKPFSLVPNPSGDRKVLEFEMLLTERFEETYELFADRIQMLQWVTESTLQGVPLDHALLEEMLAVCKADLASAAQAVETMRQRKTRLQQKLDEKGGA